eukprot:TRINITY_DN1585_c0_g1_i1.p1 TRINITY_DN1585_c0_g1~~TRINITY_DN1585_c0_g1_i1.p1  ORF type:complete len:777 (+),score=225.40 TRINITY_DN1585_c0_g1_i1:75-2405(+)
MAPVAHPPPPLVKLQNDLGKALEEIFEKAKVDCAKLCAQRFETFRGYYDDTIKNLKEDLKAAHALAQSTSTPGHSRPASPQRDASPARSQVGGGGAAAGGATAASKAPRGREGSGLAKAAAGKKKATPLEKKASVASSTAAPTTPRPMVADGVKTEVMKVSRVTSMPADTSSYARKLLQEREERSKVHMVTDAGLQCLYDMLRKTQRGYLRARDLLGAYDKNEDGALSRSELFEALTQMGYKVTREDSASVFEALDYNGDGGVSYKEVDRLLKNLFPENVVAAVSKTRIRLKEKEERKEKVPSEVIEKLVARIQSAAYGGNTSNPAHHGKIDASFFRRLGRSAKGDLVDSQGWVRAVRNVFMLSVADITDEQCLLVFEMVDDDKSGFLSMDEIADLAKGIDNIQNPALATALARSKDTRDLLRKAGLPLGHTRKEVEFSDYVEPPFKVGQTVRIQGLQARLDLNGRCAHVIEFDETRWKYNVLLDDDTRMAFIPANLKKVDSLPASRSTSPAASSRAGSPAPSSQRGDSPDRADSPDSRRPGSPSSDRAGSPGSRGRARSGSDGESSGSEGGRRKKPQQHQPKRVEAAAKSTPRRSKRDSSSSEEDKTRKPAPKQQKAKTPATKRADSESSEDEAKTKAAPKPAAAKEQPGPKQQKGKTPATKRADSESSEDEAKTKAAPKPAAAKEQPGPKQQKGKTPATKRADSESSEDEAKTKAAPKSSEDEAKTKAAPKPAAAKTAAAGKKPRRAASSGSSASEASQKQKPHRGAPGAGKAR